jgi:hypothetical protein
VASSERGLSPSEPVDLLKVTAAGLLTASTEIERQRLHVQTSISAAPLSHSVPIPTPEALRHPPTCKKGAMGSPVSIASAIEWHFSVR